ncbi:hypothetical protein ACFO1B_30915 [Dactylosporangium siamense]|uniref:Uncharacterized protein n=1 Tax=Dactylosporangium siamense TaxID=685454 RepID=A0A919PRP8_9ACTN|nr:hypothetical protein [Dactylosporangium siamense]GIG48111.1 hypothetical protein Dsi01nite_061520 [Dactylosporangium siamense]
MTYFNYPGDIAAALRALAEDFDALPPFERLPDIAVEVLIQACQHSGDTAERVSAVDLLTFVTLGQDASTRAMSGGTFHHGNGGGNRYRGDGLEVAVFTVVPAPVAAVAA